MFSGESGTFDSLCTDVLGIIVEYLPPRDLFLIGSVCHELRSIALDNRLWHKTLSACDELREVELALGTSIPPTNTTVSLRDSWNQTDIARRALGVLQVFVQSQQSLDRREPLLPKRTLACLSVIRSVFHIALPIFGFLLFGMACIVFMVHHSLNLAGQALIFVSLGLFSLSLLICLISFCMTFVVNHCWFCCYYGRIRVRASELWEDARERVEDRVIRLHYDSISARLGQNDVPFHKLNPYLLLLLVLSSSVAGLAISVCLASLNLSKAVVVVISVFCSTVGMILFLLYLAVYCIEPVREREEETEFRRSCAAASIGVLCPTFCCLLSLFFLGVFVENSIAKYVIGGTLSLVTVFVVLPGVSGVAFSSTCLFPDSRGRERLDDCYWDICDSPISDQVRHYCWNEECPALRYLCCLFLILPTLVVPVLISASMHFMHASVWACMIPLILASVCWIVLWVVVCCCMASRITETFEDV